MQVNFLASLVGLIISCVCFLVSQVVFSFTTQFYHEDKSSLKWVPHFIVFIASFVSLVFLYSSQVSTQNFAKGVLTVFIMGLIAYTDIGIDRIPIHLLVAGFIAGIFLGLLTEDLTCYLIGRFVNLLFGIGMFILGRVYLQNKKGQKPNGYSFGFGDVCALGSLGFLLGFPQGFIAMTLAFLLSVVSAALWAVFKQEVFLSMQIKLGPYFFISATVVLLFTY